MTSISTPTTTGLSKIEPGIRPGRTEETFVNRFPQDLIDREEIRNLTATYCHYVWQHDIRIVELFTDGGIFTGTKADESTWVRGRDNLLAKFKKTFSASASPSAQPMIHNHVIAFQSETIALGWCYLDVRLIRDGMRDFMWGFYDDKYEKVNGHWLFKERLFNPLDRHTLPLQ